MEHFVEILDFPLFRLDGETRSWSAHPISQYPARYIALETRFREQLAQDLPIKALNRILGYDFLQATHFGISKLVWEIPIRLILHIETLHQQTPIFQLDLRNLPWARQGLIQKNLINTIPNIITLPSKYDKWLYKWRLAHSWLTLAAASIYLILYHLPTLISQRTPRREELCRKGRSWFAAPRSYAFPPRPTDAPVLLTPLSRPLWWINRSGKGIPVFEYYQWNNWRRSGQTLRHCARLWRHQLKRCSSETYSRSYLALHLYFFFKLPLVWEFVDLITHQLEPLLPDNLLFNNGNSDYVSALNSWNRHHRFFIEHFQHGQIQSPLPYRSYCDQYLLWTNFEMRLMKKYSYDKKFQSGFYPKKQVSAKSPPTNYQLRQQPPVVVFFSNPIDEIFGQPALQEWHKIIRQFMQHYGNSLHYHLHIHPQEKSTIYRNRFPGISIAQHCAAHWLKEADLVITVYSTILVEALNYFKPVFVYRSFLDEDETLIDYISPRRIYRDCPQLIHQCNATFKEAKTPAGIDLTPEMELFHHYFD